MSDSGSDFDPSLDEDDGYDPSKSKGATNGISNGSSGAKKSPKVPKENGDKPAKTGNKRLSVERIYQKKSQLEHILLRPDTYIGSVNPVTEKMWVLDAESQRIVNKEITYTPGFYKIFDEILVNAADNKVRDAKMDLIKIDINPEKNEIKVFNNGRGIPVEHHKTENMYVPTLIFGHLLTSSNFNDEEEKVTGGRNGYGAKLCNVFSTKFTVETASKENKKEFKQSWKNNMTKAEEAKIKEFGSGTDYTRITFYPDLPKFNMEKLDDDIVALLSRRAYDVAASAKGVKVMLNGKRIPVKGFKDYVDLFLKGHEDETGSQIKCVHEIVNTNWEVAVAVSDDGFQQMSFVNSIATTKGGRHVDYVAKMIETSVADMVKKKNKGGVTIKPHQVRNHLWLFINCLIPNPTFDSQTKENMTLQQNKFASKAAFKCQLTPKFFTLVSKSGIVESVLAWSKFKADQELSKKQSSKKTNKIKGVSKLEDANNAGTKNSIGCTLILTEGDSAKTLAVAGLSVIGRDNYGVYPLKGKMLNVREATHKQIIENKEINELVKILGLQYKKKYQTQDDLKTLRYGKLMIMTDQDQDGSHIKGLVINFIQHNWPSLLHMPFLEEFITPIVKATKGNESNSFFSLPEFNEWKDATPNWHTYKVKYYKGLGTSTSKEAKEYFSDVKRHRIVFTRQGDQDDHSINMAFSKKCIEERKKWLTDWMEDCKRRKEIGLSEVYLYEKGTERVTYTDFVNKELILFSNLDNERSIPCLVDGFKPGQRKVMFTCLKRNDKREVKVAQLAGSVGEMSAYHHGEASLMGTIINLAQDFVGSNNINLLQPIGQFGTRLNGGKDSASPRYIFTQMSSLTRLIFNSNDDALLNYLKDDNQKIEPEWYMPILPLVLVNGADGIGTGWMTKIPNYNPREIVKNLKRKLDGHEMQDLNPWFKGFKGEIVPIDNQRFIINGEIHHLSDNKIEITELPIRTWTQTYKEQVMEPYLSGSEKQPAVIQDFKEYHTDKTVKFVVQMDKDKLRDAEHKGLHQFFKIQSSLSTSSMVLFDSRGCMRRYNNALEIMEEFYELRLDYYGKRKDYLEGMLEAEALKLSNQARFILEKCDGTLTVENKKKKLMIEELQRKGFDSDPVKKWKKSQEDEVEEEDNPEDGGTLGGVDYDYLLGMTMWSLTQERKEELLKKKDEKQQELKRLRGTTKEDLWRRDLDEFMVRLDEVEAKEREDDQMHLKGKLGGKGGKKGLVHRDFTPTGIRVVPRIGDELRKKVALAVAAKEKKGEKKVKKTEIIEEKDEFDMLCDDKDLNKSLSEKLGFDSLSKDDKKKGSKKGKKRKSDSFSEGDEDEDGGGDWKSSDSDSDSMFGGGSNKSAKVAKTTKKFDFEKSSDDEDIKAFSPAKVSPKKEDKPVYTEDSKDEFDMLVDEPSLGEKIKPIKKKLYTAPEPEKKAKKTKKILDSDDEDEPLEKKKKKTAPAAKKKPIKKKALDSSDDEDIILDSDEDDAPLEKKKKKPAASKKPATSAKPKASKKAKKANSSDDENDFDSLLASSSPPPVIERGGGRRAAAAAKSKFQFSSDDEDKNSDDDFIEDSYSKPKKNSKKKKSESSDESFKAASDDDF